MSKVIGIFLGLAYGLVLGITLTVILKIREPREIVKALTKYLLSVVGGGVVGTGALLLTPA